MLYFMEQLLWFFRIMMNLFNYCFMFISPREHFLCDLVVLRNALLKEILCICAVWLLGNSVASDCSWSHASADMLFVLIRKVVFQAVDPCFRGWVESKTSSSVFDISCIV